jgi:negative regulator of flagellin synthesis FlgM
MKITDLNQGSKTIQYINQANSAEKPALSQETKNGPPLTDKVELSPQSKEMGKINDLLQTVPDIRTDRVLELKKVIQDGQYKIDSEQVAEKMLNESLLDIVK